MATDNSHTIATHLNAVLKNELTSINQYFLHARLLKHLGYVELADHEYKESINVMRNTDHLVERILALGGLPNVQDLGKLFIGQNVGDILQGDLKLAQAAQGIIQSGLAACAALEDQASARLLDSVRKRVEEHVRFAELQLGVIAQTADALKKQAQA